MTERIYRDSSSLELLILPLKPSHSITEAEEILEILWINSSLL